MTVFYIMLSFKALEFGKGKDSQRLLLKLPTVLGLKYRGNKFLNKWGVSFFMLFFRKHGLLWNRV